MKHVLDGIYISLTNLARIKPEQEPRWRTYFLDEAINQSAGFDWNYERRTYDPPMYQNDQEFAWLMGDIGEGGEGAIENMDFMVMDAV